MLPLDRSCGAMDSALDFGSRGCGFESHLDRFLFFTKFVYVNTNEDTKNMSAISEMQKKTVVS